MMKKSRQALKVIICSMLALALLVTLPSGKISKQGNDGSISPLSTFHEYEDV